MTTTPNNNDKQSQRIRNSGVNTTASIAGSLEDTLDGSRTKNITDTSNDGNRDTHNANIFAGLMQLWWIFWHSARLEWHSIVGNRLEKMMLLWMPAIAVGAVWYTFSSAQVHDLPIGVLDKNNSTLSRKLIQMVDASPNVAIAKHYSDTQSIQRDLNATSIYGALIIPNNFSKKLYHIQPSPVTLHVNAQFGTHSGIVQSGVGSAVRTFSAGVELNLRKKMGLSDEQAQAAFMPLQPQTKMAFNQSINYQLFLASTIIPALLHILATVVGVGAIGRELRHKTLDTWIDNACGQRQANTLPFFAMLAALNGKLLWQMLAFSFWSIITLLLVSSQSSASTASLAITMLDAWLLTLISLWLGVILTTLTMSKRMGLSNAGIITAPAFAYSGITFPLVSMPDSAQNIASLLPLTHYLKSQIAQLQTTIGWQAALPVTYGFVLAVMVMAVVSTLLTLRALKRKHHWGKR